MDTIKQSLVICMLMERFGRIDGRTRLQKLLFLLDKKLNLDLGFERALYGPFSNRLSAIADTLTRDKIIKEEFSVTDFGKKYSYILTDEGKNFIKSMKSNNDIQKIEKVLNEVDSFVNMDLEELLRFIYKTYPEFAGEFKFSKSA